ncbi:MAG: hypothetical protein E6Q50_03830 [Lysobacter sp.]|nr:MAG: hypothetical protein E6Q50_03830 [Lysobacter sp.]
MKRLAPIFLLLVAAGAADAGEKRVFGAASTPSSSALRLSPQQRAEIARSLVRIWAPDVRKSGGNVQEWAVKLGRFVGTADPANLRQAIDMPTYTTMMDVLLGQPVASKSVQKALAQAQAGDVGIETIGSAIADTTYTPLPNGRCRVADSRVIASPLAAGVTRAIDVESVGSYASQGGNGTFANGDGSTNCGLPGAGASTALAVSVTVLSTGSEGFFKIFENGKPFQTGSTVYYTGAVSASNDVIVTTCQSCANELSIYASSSVNYVVDVVGYFAPPVATALQCTRQFGSFVNVPANTYGFGVSAVCPTGYTATGLGIEAAANVVMADSSLNNSGGTVFTYNLGATAQSTRAWVQCCRVPGR